MQKSAVQLKIEAQLQASIDLLKRAKPYVGRATTIGGQDLSREISEFVATVDRNPSEPMWNPRPGPQTEFMAKPNVCMACGGQHPTGNLPCPHMISYADTTKS